MVVVDRFLGHPVPETPFPHANAGIADLRAKITEQFKVPGVDAKALIESQQRNIETFTEIGVEKVITHCAHCFNTICNEYPQFGGVFDVRP